MDPTPEGQEESDDQERTLRRTSASESTLRPQTCPAGEGRGRLSRLSGSAADLSASAGRGAGAEKQLRPLAKPKPAPLYRRSLPLYFDYRKKESAALKRIEHSPIVQLYPGNIAGGTTTSLNNSNIRRQDAMGDAAENGGNVEQRNSPSVFRRFPEFEEQFESLVRKCTANQRDTRGLYRSMRREESLLGEKVAVLQDKLRIMQSMPDISMPTREFDLFIKNAMEQQKALDKEMSGQFNSESLGTKHRGSIRHIFPLRNVHTGRVAKGERATIWQR